MKVEDFKKKKLHPAGNNQLYFIFVLFIYIYTSYPERRDLFFWLHYLQTGFDNRCAHKLFNSRRQ